MFLLPPPQMSSLYLPLPFLFLEKQMANPLQYSCLENPMDGRGLAGYTLWGIEESDRAERLTNTHPYSCPVSQSPLPRDALSLFGMNMGRGWLQLSPGRELGSQQTAETAGQESVETPHFAAAWLEEFTQSGSPSVSPSGSWDHL